MMNFRIVSPEILLDINQLSNADYIRLEDRELVIGPLVRHASLRASPLVLDHFPLMALAYQYVAHSAIRNRGTLCGNLSHADPSSEMPAVMLAHDAKMVVSSLRGVRTIEARDFFLGLYQTALEPDEFLAEVRIPLTAESVGWGFEEVSVRRGDYAMTLVAALLWLEGGRIARAAIAFAGVSDRALRDSGIEQNLVGQVPSAALFAEAGLRASQTFPLIEDINADAAYRRDLIKTLTTRALISALEHAKQ